MGDRSGVRTGATPGRVLRRRSRGRPRSGQSVAEFALVLPVLVAILGGIIQFGVIFWAQNTLTQVVRDTGRWAATQKCSTTNPPGVGVLAEAKLVAGNASLIGYTADQWTTATNFTTATYGTDGDTAMDTFSGEGVAVAWVADNPNGESCPPSDNQAVYHVTIKINHAVPVFFPGMQYLPGIGSNGKIMLSSTAQFRMEPVPNP